MERKTLIMSIVITVMAATAVAQDADYRAMDSPFQESYEFAINTDLQPKVEVAGPVRCLRQGRR